MPDATPRKSATILSFDEKARALRARQGRPPAVQQAPVPAVVFGSGWYHDEAIREADPTRKP